MGFFINENTLNSYNYYNGYHTDLYSPSNYTIYDEGVDINYTTLGYEIVAESQQEWNTLMKQVALSELAVYESTGCKEVLYEAVDFGALFTRIRNFFKKLVDKVKAIFHSFMAKLSSILSKDSNFAKKYGDEFNKNLQNIRDDFEFKGYTFTIKNFSSRDDITFDNQLANIYLDKAKIGEKKLDTSIRDLLSSRGSVSGNLLDPTSFLESVGYYSDNYQVLDEYKLAGITEYDKYYILHHIIINNIGNYHSLLNDNDINTINNLYNKKLGSTDKGKVTRIFNKIYSHKFSVGKTKNIEATSYLSILINTLDSNDKDFIKNCINLKKSIITKGDMNTIDDNDNNLISKLINTKVTLKFKQELLNQYSPSDGNSSGSGSQQQQNSQTNNNSGIYDYDIGQYNSLYQNILSQVHFSGTNNKDSFEKEVDKIEKKYNINKNDRLKLITRSEADKCLKEIEDLKNRYNKAYQAQQATSSSNTGNSSGSGSQQQQVSSSDKMSKKDFSKKIIDLKNNKLNSASLTNEFIAKHDKLLDDYNLLDDYFDKTVTELNKTNAEKYLAELEKFVEELNKRNPQSSSSRSTNNSVGNSVSGSSRTIVGGRDVQYSTPALKVDAYKRANVSIRDASEDIHNSIRGAVAALYTNGSASESYNENEFKNELFKLFRNGAENKQSIPASEIKKISSEIVQEVATYKKTKDMAKEATNTVVRAIDSVISKLDEYIKRSDKNWNRNTDNSLLTNFTSLLTTISDTFFKTSRSDIVLANGIYLTALKDRCSQNKNIMVKVIAGSESKKMKNTNESYNYGYDNDYSYNSGSSFLDNIIFK